MSEVATNPIVKFHLIAVEDWISPEQFSRDADDQAEEQVAAEDC